MTDPAPCRPRKATLNRLLAVLKGWQSEESNLCRVYGPPDDLPRGCHRIQRIKDADALQEALAYLEKT